MKEFIAIRRLKQFVHVHRGTLLDVLILMLVGLLPLSWFRDGLLINGNEFNFTMSTEAHHFFYTWLSTNAPGVAATRQIAEIPFRSLILLLGNLGVSLVAIEAMYFTFFFMASGLSMYLLVSTLVSGEKRRIAALTAAFFWMFNPYVMNYMWHVLMPLEMNALFPLIFALYVRGLRKENNLPFVFLIAILFASILSHVGINVVEMFMPIFTLFSYLLLYLLENRRDRAKLINAFKYNAFLIALCSAFSMWWLLPQFSALGRELSASLHVTENVGATVGGTLELESRAASLLEVLRMGGIWSFFSGNRGDPYYSYATVYLTPAFQLIGFLIPLLAFAALLKRRDKHILLFGLIALVGIFLMKGINPPFGNVFVWLFNHIPLFSIFRHFQLRFGPLLTISYAFLIGVATSEIYYFIRNLKKPALNSVTKKAMAIVPVLLIFVSIFGIYSFPMWTGEVITIGGKNVTPSLHIQVPDYYYAANNWLKQQKSDFKILALPYSRLFYATYDWKHGYTGSDPSLWLFSTPTLMGYNDENYAVPLLAGEILAGLSDAQQTEYVGKILKLLNAKYLLVHRDAFWARFQGDPWYVSASEDSIKNSLEKQKGIHLEKTFGELDFYRNEYWQPMQAYAPDEVILADSNVNGLPAWASLDDTSAEPVLFLSSDLDKEEVNFLSKKADNFISAPLQEGLGYQVIAGTAGEIDEDFEGDSLAPWFVGYTPGSSIALTDKDAFSGSQSAEITMNGGASQGYLYRDYSYDGNSPINIDARIKVVSREAPGGAYIYLKGYDAAGTEKVRVMYSVYDNWDAPTGTPGQHPEIGSYSYYSLKVFIENPTIGTWIHMNQNPKYDFEALFPGIWEKLGLTNIRLELRNWSDKEIISRYDDIGISGVSEHRVDASIRRDFVAPREGDYLLSAGVSRDFHGELKYRIDNGELQTASSKNVTPGQLNMVELGNRWLGEGNHSIEFFLGNIGEYYNDGFETGNLGPWVTEAQSSESSVRVTSGDSHTGNYSTELILNEHDNDILAYQDFAYDGHSSFALNAWMKVVSRGPKSGTFIQLKGIDAYGAEKVRLIYFVYDNWDAPTGTPGQHTEYGQYSYYTLKTKLGNPELNSWLNANQHPRDEFEATFPGVWEKLGLTRIRLELHNWGNDAITSRYDDFNVSGVVSSPVYFVSARPTTVASAKIADVTLREINPTKYEVHVKALQPCFLVLSESYHPDWKLYYGDTNWIEAFFKKPLAETNHFKANGYANAWYIDQAGDYDITLHFKTQSWFYLGVAISLISIVSSTICFIWKRKREHLRG